MKKNYIVHGIKRRSSSLILGRIDHIYQDHEVSRRFILHYGDLTDSTNLIRIIQEVKPDEIYNLGAQSHVSVSFESPEYTANSDALGVLRILEAIRILGLKEKQNSIKLALVNYMEKFKKVLKKKKHHFIQEVHTE